MFGLKDMILKNAIAECVWGAGWHARGDGWRGHWHVHPMSTTLEKYSANERSYTYLILPFSIIYYSGVWNALPTKSWNQCMLMLLPCNGKLLWQCCSVSDNVRKIPEHIKQCQDPRNLMICWYAGMLVWWYDDSMMVCWYGGMIMVWWCADIMEWWTMVCWYDGMMMVCWYDGITCLKVVATWLLVKSWFLTRHRPLGFPSMINCFLFLFPTTEQRETWGHLT